MAIRYLNNSDYQIDIRDTQLYVVYNNQLALERCERLAQEEVAYYITQRFDLTKEFTNTGSYSLTATYSANDRVINDYSSWTSSATYSYNNGVIYNGEAYICATTSIGATTSFNKSLWYDLGAQYKIYSVPYPAPLFDDLTYYNQDDIVFWEGITYSCQSPTTPLNYTTQAQYLYLQYVPSLNVFPNDTKINNNYQYWLPGASQSYKVPAGTLPTNTTFWLDRDNRCQQLVNACLDMVLYYLERTIANRNIPEMREMFYKKACKMLDDVGDGTYTISALVRQNGQGTMFRFGGPTPDAYNGW